MLLKYFTASLRAGILFSCQHLQFNISKILSTDTWSTFVSIKCILKIPNSQGRNEA
jgi:hypothetical protein